MSRDVVFYESASWYTIDLAPPEPTEMDFNIDSEKDDRLRLTKEESPLSTRLSEPQEPPSGQITSRPSPKPNKGKGKMLEFKDFDGN